MHVRVETAAYAVIALASLAATWTFNIQLMLAGGTLAGFLKQAYANNVAATVATDISFCGVLLFAWMVREAKRHGVKHAWAYLLFSMTIAISAVFPLFLIARRRAIEAHGAEVRGVTRLTAAYPIFAGVSFVLVNYFVVRFALEGLPWSVFFEAWFGSPGAGSLSADLLGLSAALLVFLTGEARRGHVKRVAAYVAMCAFGVAFALPWFLRELDTSGGTPSSGK